jgi:small subunit ribosomal protein S16
VKIRLMRMGKKKQPTYRVVVADGRSPRDGRYIEILGQYRPREEPSFFSVDDEKILGWLRQGAQPSDQVHRLLVGAGIWERYESDRTTESRAVKTAKAKAKGAEAAKADREAQAKAAAEAEAKAAAASAAEASAEAAAAEEAPAEDAATDEAAE